MAFKNEGLRFFFDIFTSYEVKGVPY